VECGSERAVQHRAIVKDYSQLSPDERDEQSGCSVCAEDQETIRINGIPEFSVCRKYAPAIRDSIITLIRQGEKISSVIGYRVGRTRGDLDAEGNRSGFSNHSYGIAIESIPNTTACMKIACNSGRLAGCCAAALGNRRPILTACSGRCHSHAAQAVRLQVGRRNSGENKRFHAFFADRLLIPLPAADGRIPHAQRTRTNPAQTLIERYISDGQPVGSRALQQYSGWMSALPPSAT